MVPYHLEHTIDGTIGEPVVCGEVSRHHAEANTIQHWTTFSLLKIHLITLLSAKP